MPVTEAVRLVVPHANDVKEPQLPENTWTFAPDELRFVPMEVRLTAKLLEKVDVVILYHTSSSGVPVAQPTGIPELAVAFHTVPVLFVVPDVNAIALAQSSLDGGVV